MITPLFVGIAEFVVGKYVLVMALTSIAKKITLYVNSSGDYLPKYRGHG